MRLEVKQPAAPVHTDLASGCGWSVWNELFTCSDDQTIQKWSLAGEPEGKVCQLDTYFTDMHWYPLSSKKNQAGGTDVFAVGCTNGSFKIISRTGRIEKSVDAHTGACIGLRWSYDGTALATAGEDGSVKIWSRTGMLRSTLAQHDSPVYCVVWAADSDQLCFSTGPSIVIRSLQSSAKQHSWRAHEGGVVLKLDWSPINHMIVSGGEDCKYKVWDSYGRLLYQSAPLDAPVTCVSWCPSGDSFAVGSFDTLLLCDAMGWAHSKSHLTKAGSVLGLSWTPDGTQLAGACGSGAAVFGAVVDVGLEDGRVRVVASGERRLLVQDILSETQDELDFRDKVVKIALGFEQLLVATSTQCHIYSTAAWNTPHIFDLKDTVTLLQQAERHFLLMDNVTGIQLFTYEGRQICNPKSPGLRTELLNGHMVSISNDTLAVLDVGSAPSAGSSLRFFDTAQGRPLGEPFTHALEIKEIALSQAGTSAERQLLFIDRNRDLYVMGVAKRQPAKLAAMVDSAAWHHTTGLLAAMVDCKLTVWYHPLQVFVDQELLAQARYVKSDGEYGKAARIVRFSGSKALIRRSDGVLVTAATSPYPLLLHDMAGRAQWDKATRLCRFIKDPSMWACLAAMALAAKELHTAEAAFAALDETAKRHWVAKVKAIPTEEGRSAELALYRRRPDEAEAILIQAGLVWRAIKLNVKLFRWERALELAQKAGQHVDAVLWYRQRYLAAAQAEEVLPTFQAAAEQLVVDEAAVRAAIQQEKAREAQRPGAKRYV